MVQHVLLPVNIHFHGNLLIFEFLTIVLIFILVAILKILKTKSTTLSNDQFSNFATVAMEMKKGGFKKELIPFIKLHEIL
jgi:hypothetical protein